MARKRAFMPGIISPVEIGAYYAAADVFVLPSMFQETFGLVVLEAFSAGCPSSPSDRGAFPNSSNIDGTGFLSAKATRRRCSAACVSWRVIRICARVLSAEGKKTAEKFRWDNTVDRLEGIYETVLKRRKTFA